MESKYIGLDSSILYRCNQKYFDKQLQEYGIGYTQFAFLMTLYENEGISMNELALKGSFDKGTITKSIQKLEQLDYVRIENSESDKRSKLLYTSDKARDIMPKLYMLRQEWKEYLSSELSDEEKDQLDADTLEAYESAYKVGLLRGDSTLRSIRSQLRNVMSSIVKGVNSEFNSLSDIGISTGAIGSSYTETMVGKLEIKDEEALKKAIEESPNDISSLFNAETGIARKLKETLNSFTSSSGILTKRVGRSDSSVSNEFSTQIDSINKQISAQQLRLNARQEALIKQFAELETAMSNYQSQSSTFASYFQK